MIPTWKEGVAPQKSIFWRLKHLTHNGKRDRNREQESKRKTESRMISVSNNFTWVSADARPSRVFRRGWRHDSINKSDPYGAADVFLISLCSAIESHNWLSLQHLPNSEVCVFAAVQKKKKESLQIKPKQEAENRFSLWGACIRRIVPLLEPKVYPPGSEASFLRLRGLFKGSSPDIHGRAWRGSPRTRLGIPNTFWRFFEE